MLAIYDLYAHMSCPNVKSVSDQAKKPCKKVGEAKTLAMLFGGSRKHSFDLRSECVVASQQAKKKTTNQRMKPKGCNCCLA